MKKALLLKPMLLLFALIVGSSSAWAIDINLTTDPVTIDNFLPVGSSYLTTATDKTIGGYTWSVYQCMNLGKYSGVTYNNLQMKKNDGYIISPTVTSSNGFTVTVTYSSKSALTLQIGNETAQTGSTTSTNAQAGTGATVSATTTSTSTSFKLSAGSEVAYVSSIVITPTSGGGDTPPSISADDVPIAYDATVGSIAYTINNGVEGGSVSAAITEGDWITSLGQGTASPISFTCSANSETTARTATITLTYTYNTTETVTKVVTITQAAAPVLYTTIPALFAAATSTETNVLVTFNNWVVSGVSTIGRNVFVTDNNGNGFMIYSTSDLSETYSVGDILSGTAVPCTLVLYGGYAEITNLDASDLTITDGGTVSVSNIAMADLSGVNTGALVSYNGLTCSINNNKYYLSDGTTTIQLHNSLYAFEALDAGDNYNITGIYQQYNDTKEILPRKASDIVKVVVPKHTLTVVAANGSVGIEGKTLDEDGQCEINEGASVIATATPVEHYTFSSWTADGFTLENATVNPLTFTMPANDATLTATFTEDPKYTATFYVLGAEAGTDEDVYEGEAITFPSVTAPSGYFFKGWTKTELPAAQATAPADLVTSANMGTSNVTYYAVFAQGTETTVWKKTAANAIAEAGVYAILTKNGYAFNGLMDNGHGQVTSTAFSFNDNDEATIAPEGTCELTFAVVTNGYTWYNASYGYLYAKAASKQNLAWHNTESGYWHLSGSNWKYKGSDYDAYLRSYNDNSIRTYASSDSGEQLVFAKKETTGSYSGYCTTIPTGTTATITLNAACTDGEMVYGTYSNSSAFVVSDDLIVSEITVDGGKLWVESYETGDVVPANTGVMVAALAGGDYTVNLSSETGTSVLGVDNMLKASGDASITAEDMAAAAPSCKYYRLTMHNGTDIGFWWGAANGAAFAIAANKAYLAVPTSVGAPEMGMWIDDETTGIVNVNRETITNNQYYTLDGRRVAEPTKGLYILNGKKVVIK